MLHKIRRKNLVSYPTTYEIAINGDVVEQEADMYIKEDVESVLDVYEDAIKTRDTTIGKLMDERMHLSETITTDAEVIMNNTKRIAELETENERLMKALELVKEEHATDVSIYKDKANELEKNNERQSEAIRYLESENDLKKNRIKELEQACKYVPIPGITTIYEAWGRIADLEQDLSIKKDAITDLQQQWEHLNAGNKRFINRIVELEHMVNDNLRKLPEARKYLYKEGVNGLMTCIDNPRYNDELRCIETIKSLWGIPTQSKE